MFITTVILTSWWLLRSSAGRDARARVHARVGYRMTVVRRERSACLRSSVTIIVEHIAVQQLLATHGLALQPHIVT